MFVDVIGVLLILLVLAGLITTHIRGWSFNKRVFLALVLGIVLGCLFRWWQPYTVDGLKVSQSILAFLGQAYFDFLKMLVIPLILTSIIHAILQLGAHQQSGVLGRIAWKSVALLLVLTAVASGIGMLIAMALGVGQGMSLPDIALTPSHHYSGLTDTLLGMIPSNPVAMMVNENTVAMVIFAILVGIAGLMLGRSNPDKLPAFQAWIQSVFFVMKKLASLVIRMTPYGVFGLIGDVMIEQGAQSLQGLVIFALAMYVAMVAMLIVHGLVLWFAGQNPWRYYRLAYAPLLVAFTTRSSFGTLPVTEETLDKKLGLRQVTATFVPSIGATMGMNACAGIFPAVLVVMAMTITHQPITIGIIFLVMAVNAMASLGISGIPGTAFIAATVTLTTLGLPYSVVGLVQGIDPIIDMGRTAVNVNGTMTAAVVADRTTKDYKSVVTP